jgi:3-hydroxyacyl-[acyl-carrier-protein] dehydratase
MAPQLLFDISGIDLDRVAHGAEEIERVNPHRGVMRLIDGICWISDDRNRAVAFKQVRDDEFWVPGHIPGRPLFPGVLMVEAAAQVASYLTKLRRAEVNFMGFVGIDDVKFRGQVVPGDKLYIIGEGQEFRQRRSVCKVQGLVRGNLVFEATITGMPI